MAQTGAKGSMTNTDERAASFRMRLINIEEERRARMEDAKEIAIEMKQADLTKAEIVGIKLSVKRHFETLEKKLLRETAESFAAALGDFADMPLGRAAMERVEA
jgi:hypothetical protein